MTIHSDILRNHGIFTKRLIAYGQPSLSALLPDFPTSQDAVNFYASMGFGIYPIQDLSDGYTSNVTTIYSLMKSVGGGILLGTYGWGYVTGFMFNCAAKYPDDVEYYLVAGTFVKASSYNINGIVQDSPNFLAEWVKQYQAADAGIGLQNTLGISGWPQSDHPVNYGGAQGNNGAHNMRTYARYVNSTLGYYLLDVNDSGVHNKDSTPCLLWGLRGVNPNSFTGQVTVSGPPYSGGIIPTLALATDLNAYHRASGTFITYYVTAGDANVEATLLQMVQAKGSGAFARTAIPYQYIQNIPAYAGSPLAIMTPTYNSAYAVTRAFGGALIASPYFNWASSLDNSSNPGQSGTYGVATAATVTTFWTGVAPYLSHADWFDVDTDEGHIKPQSIATNWKHYSDIWSKIPVGGNFGDEQNALNILTIDHYSNVFQTWSCLGAICRQWAADSQASLAGVNFNNYKVILGMPTQATDISSLKAAVNGGVNLILYRSGPSDLTAGAVPLTASHPIFAPYAAADLNAAFTKGFGTINNYGAGKVLVLPQSYYGEGFSVSDTSNGQGGSDSLASGLAWVTTNAILWLGGLPAPAMWLPQYVKRTSWATALNNNGQGGISGIGVHVLGQKNGVKTILLSNGTITAQPVAFSLDSAFYGFPMNYALKDVNTGQMISGSGSSIAINVTIPPQDLMAFVSTTSQTPTTITVTAKAH